MSSTICQHGKMLPRGLRCCQGYLIIRLKTKEGPLNRSFGIHTSEAEQFAKDELESIRISQRKGLFTLKPKTVRLTFREASALYQQKHFIEYKDPRTLQPRSKNSIESNAGHLTSLNEFFGRMWFDAISLRDLKKFREKRLKDGISPATANRQISVISSMWKMLKTWNAGGDIESVQLSLENPCSLLPDLFETPRNRVASLDELRRLKEACNGDQDLWAIVEMSLLTCLRLGDLKKLNGQMTIVQGKTGRPITFPEGLTLHGVSFVNFRTRFKQAIKRARITDLTFRDLRKTGLRLLESQFTAESIAQLAGHANSKTTKLYYLSGPRPEALKPLLDASRVILGAL